MTEHPPTGSFHEWLRAEFGATVEALEQAFADPGRPVEIQSSTGPARTPWEVARMFPGHWRFAFNSDLNRWRVLYEGSLIIPRSGDIWSPRGTATTSGRGYYTPRATREAYPDHEFRDDWPPSSQLPRTPQRPR